VSWARDLIQVPTLLLEIVSLLREQNSLHRELILSLTSRAPSTRLTTPSPIFVRPPLNRKYTADDVSVVTREMREEQQILEQQRAGAPWRADVPAPASTPPSSSGDGDVAPTSPSASPPPDPASPSPPQP
jgi:hypothetical protein